MVVLFLVMNQLKRERRLLPDFISLTAFVQKTIIIWSLLQKSILITDTDSY